MTTHASSVRSVAEVDAAALDEAARTSWFLSGSRWDDACWTFAATNKTEERRSLRVRWDFTLPRGGCFTDPPHARLLESARRLIVLMRTRSLTRQLPKRATTVFTGFVVLRVLLRWMNEEGFSRFSELDDQAIDRFIRFLAQRPLRYRSDAKLRSRHTLMTHLTVFIYLHRYRELIGDGLVKHPFGGVSAGKYIGARDRDRRPWPYTPDVIAVPLVQGAIDYLEESAIDILRLREIYRNAQATVSERVSRGYAASKAGLQALQRCPLVVRGRPYVIEGLPDFTSLVEYLYAACFVVISYLVGARASEIMYLESGCVRSASDDPTAPDTGTAILVGTIFKQEADYHGRPHQWVIPVPVVHAISILEALSSPHRARANRPQLWLRAVGSTHTRGMGEWNIAAKWPLMIPSVAWMRVRLGLFSEWLKLPLHDGKPWRLATHQGRKTFARFVALRDRSSLFALAQHLGHRDRAISDMHYAGNDYALEQEIGSEVLEHSVCAWEQMLSAESLGGRAGAQIVAKRPRFRGERAKQDLTAYARMLADAGLRLGVCDWGYCVYREEYSACLGDASGPNPVRREPSTCARCRNFAVSVTHRVYWDEQVRRHEALLNNPELPLQSLKIARERLGEALTMIRAIDGNKSDTGKSDAETDDADSE